MADEVAETPEEIIDRLYKRHVDACRLNEELPEHPKSFRTECLLNLDAIKDIEEFEWGEQISDGATRQEYSQYISPK